MPLYLPVSIQVRQSTEPINIIIMIHQAKRQGILALFEKGYISYFLNMDEIFELARFECINR